jgi:hypothetical protein
VRLQEISHLTALEADGLGLQLPTNVEEIQTMRGRMRGLAAVMMRYTLSMSSDDCGGLSEYSEYFTALRECFGVTRQRAEIDDGNAFSSQRIADCLFLVWFVVCLCRVAAHHELD